MEEEEMGGACGRRMGDQKCMRHELCLENLKQWRDIVHLDVDET